MSDNSKDNKDFVFIKEQIRPKRGRIFRKFLFPFIMMILMAVVFGLVAAVTFCITEPRLYKLLHKEEANPSKNMLQAAAQIPADEGEPENNNDEPDDNFNQGPVNTEEKDDDKENGPENPDENSEKPPEDKPEDNPQPVVIEAIDADIEDYLAIFNDLKKLSNETEKSILTVSSIIQGKDWFGNPVEKKIDTTGIVVENNGIQMKLLVSLDRVKDASSIKIELNDDVAVDAVLQDYETELNLAVIAVNIADIPVKFLDSLAVARLGESYSVMVGSPIIALGNPNGYPLSIDIGIITSKGRTVSITDNELDLFHTNMVFNDESDGVIVNLEGEVIGLISRTLKNDPDSKLSTVIGISKAKQYIDRMLGQTPRIYCGVIAENLPQAAKTEYNVNNGVYVYEVIKDSPAFKAGLMCGDIILGVGDQSIYNMNSFFSAISGYEPGIEVPFKIKRTSASEDKEMELEVILDVKQQ